MKTAAQIPGYRIAIVLVGLLVCVCSARAHTFSLSIFESDVILNADGSAVVTEHIASPGPLAAFERAIRVRSAGPLGSEHRLMVKVLEVTDGGGTKLAYHQRFDGDYVRIHAPGAGRTLQITYALWNPVHFAGDHDEFFWPANPPDAAAGSAVVRITLPEAAAGQFGVQGFLRAASAGIPQAALWSSSGRVPLRTEGTTLTLAAPGPLAVGVTMVADIFVAKGVFREPAAITRIGWFLECNPVVLLPVIVTLVLLLVRSLKGGSSDARRSVAPMYAPPEGLTPAEAGVLIDDKLDPRDITATLIDLAVRGYVQIEPCAPDAAGERDFIFRLLKPRDDAQPSRPPAVAELAADAGLARHEYTMLFHTFYGGHWTKLSSLRLRFYDVVPIMRAQILEALRRKGLYRVDPEQAQKWRLAGLGAATMAILVAHESGMVSLFDSPLLAAAMIGISVVIALLLGRRMTAKTRRGMQTYIALLGLQEFISKVDADRLERVETLSFEKLLPYAMALGVEHRLAHAFHDIATTSPDWYAWADGHAFDSLLFSRHVDALVHQTRGILSTRPRGKMPGAAAAQQVADPRTRAARA